MRPAPLLRAGALASLAALALGSASPAQACSGAATDPIRCINGNQKILGFGTFFRDNLMPFPIIILPPDLLWGSARAPEPEPPVSMQELLNNAELGSNDPTTFKVGLAKWAEASSRLDPEHKDTYQSMVKTADDLMKAGATPEQIREGLASPGGPPTPPPQNNDFGR
ncbi:MAG: hypothetical protein HZC25_04345 [Rhodospirillales bacterium]|nr:hypothetical protein [Rhodospirillales bacterium]